MDSSEALARTPVPEVVARQTFSYSFGSVRTAVLDTGYILARLAERVRYGGGRPFSGPNLGRARVFASEHILDELYTPDNEGNRHKWDRLAKQSQRQGWPTAPKAFCDVFETEYLDQITFVDTAGLLEHDLAADEVLRRGAGDVPTARLAMLLSRTRPLVCSTDQALFSSGLVPQAHHFQAVLAAEKRVAAAGSAEADAIYLGAGLVWAFNGAARTTAGVLRIPNWAVRAGLASSTLWASLRQEQRAKLAGTLAPVGRFLEHELEQAAAGLSLHSKSGVQSSAGDRIECRIAEVLARHPGERPLLAGEIQDEMARDTAFPHGPPAASEIAAALASAACFVERSHGRYRLGCVYERAGDAPDV